MPLSRTAVLAGCGGKPVAADSTPACDNTSRKLAKGQSPSTGIAFDIPKQRKPLVVEYVSGSGYGDTVLWSPR
jgi:hypothetical protein